MAIDIRDKLKDTMQESGLSPEQAAVFIGCTGQQVRRWLNKESVPTLVYRKAIELGIKRIQKL